jgi:uncharacterized protein (UPF0303 family)
LPVLDEHEEETVLPEFNADVAFELGLKLREAAMQHSQPVAINISGINGQTLFHALSRPGPTLDNQHWIERKARTVKKFSRSSFYMGCKARAQGKTISSFFIDEKDYAFHGGGFPIRVTNVEPIVGIIVVSGLRQDHDHLLVVNTLKAYKASLK